MSWRRSASVTSLRFLTFGEGLLPNEHHDSVIDGTLPKEVLENAPSR
jgi:hypothetical protein